MHRTKQIKNKNVNYTYSGQVPAESTGNFHQVSWAARKKKQVHEVNINWGDCCIALVGFSYLPMLYACHSIVPSLECWLEQICHMCYDLAQWVGNWEHWLAHSLKKEWISFVFYCFENPSITRNFGTTGPIQVGYFSKWALQSNRKCHMFDFRLIILDRITYFKAVSAIFFRNVLRVYLKYLEFSNWGTWIKILW